MGQHFENLLGKKTSKMNKSLVTFSCILFVVAQVAQAKDLTKYDIRQLKKARRVLEKRADDLAEHPARVVKPLAEAAPEDVSTVIKMVPDPEEPEFDLMSELDKQPVPEPMPEFNEELVYDSMFELDEEPV